MLSNYAEIMRGMKSNAYSEEEIYSVVLLVKDLEKYADVKLFQRKLFNALTQKEQYLDIWAEGKVALILAFSGFEVTLYPFGHEGVDLRVAWQDYNLQPFFVEVARFRENYQTREELKKAIEKGILVPYGRGEKDVEAVYQKIITEAAQLPRNEIGLVFLKSDNVTIEDVEFEPATMYLQELVSKNSTYTRLSGVLFDSGWVKTLTGERFHLWRNPKAEMPIDDVLAAKLIRLKEPPTHSMDELAELKKRFPIS